MSSIDLQLSLDCGACGVVVPINAFVGEVVCWSCERHTKLDETIWKLLLELPLQSAGQLAAGVEQAATVRSDVGTFHRVFHAGAPMCNACRAPMPAKDLRALAARAGSSGLAHCTQCNDGVYLRTAPPLLTAAGVVALAGETDASRAKQPVTLACTTCGGQLQVDGSSKLVACGYCRASQYLPDELFLSLRSLPVRQWSLLLSDAVAQPVATAKADWALLYDLIADAHGNLYAWGMRKGNQARSKAALMDALAHGRVLESHGISSL
ncbi:MAG TPA: hypothetical protein VNG33_05845, partial [Polyangiaceae bacterium]|nr:hypothetical protein [Polyangiaceae bacterium]